MAISLIDDAVYTKIQGWIKDPKMVILKPNETLRLFQTISDQTNDKPLTLPLIALSRDSEIQILQTNKKPLSFSGVMLEANSKNIQLFNGIPIEVNYQLDIYTKGFAEGDEYLRNFVFNFVNHPRLIVNIPYNKVNLKHTANVRINATVSDTSDIPQRLFPGQFTRWTIRLNVDDCYLFSIPINTTPSLVLDTVEIVQVEAQTAQSENIKTGEIKQINIGEEEE
jgi:hypothetical protein